MARTNLKIFRIKQGMSQDAFAKEIGYTREHYRRVESGVYDYTLRFERAMRSRFNLTHDEFEKIMAKDEE
jgi:DNA-binding XRE family transcriptional regulator